MSQVRKMREVVCASIIVFLLSEVEVSVFVCSRSSCNHATDVEQWHSYVV